MTDEAYEATPVHELERQIMSYNEAKNEREWWAMHEIERLRAGLREIAEGDRPDNDEQFCVGYWGATARAALGEGKE